MRTKDDSISITWSELRERVDALAGGLAKLGVKRGDTVALMLSNRPEFHLADLAVMTLGAVPYSIYLTSSPEQIAYVVGDAGSKVAIVEEAFLGSLPALETVIVLEGARGEGRWPPRTSRARTPTSTSRRRGARSSPRTC